MLVQLLNLKYIYDSFSLRHHDVIMSDSFSTLFNVTSICWLSFITSERVHDKNATYSCNWKFAINWIVAIKSWTPYRKNINTTWTNVTKHKISGTFWIPWHHLVLKPRSLGAARSNGYGIGWHIIPSEVVLAVLAPGIPSPVSRPIVFNAIANGICGSNNFLF